VGHLRALQDADIAGKDHPAVAARDRDYFRIVEIVAIMGVQAKNSQQASEASEVYVQNEPSTPKRPWAQTGQASDIETLEHRIHGDSVSVAKVILETYRFTVCENHVYLGVRYADGLYRVFHRRIPAELVVKAPAPPFGGKEIAELLVESKLGAVQLWIVFIHEISVLAAGRLGTRSARRAGTYSNGVAPALPNSRTMW
jgi:hypothetical protein